MSSGKATCDSGNLYLQGRRISTLQLLSTIQVPLRMHVLNYHNSNMHVDVQSVV